MITFEQAVEMALTYDVRDNKKIFLNRPFAYTVASSIGHPLFVGIVNDPTL